MSFRNIKISQLHGIIHWPLCGQCAAFMLGMHTWWYWPGWMDWYHPNMAVMYLQPHVTLHLEVWFHTVGCTDQCSVTGNILTSVFSVCPRLSASSRIAHLLPEEQVYLNQQSGTIRLDCFTHCLIVKCAPDITVSLVIFCLLAFWWRASETKS